MRDLLGTVSGSHMVTLRTIDPSFPFPTRHTVCCQMLPNPSLSIAGKIQPLLPAWNSRPSSRPQMTFAPSCTFSCPFLALPQTLQLFLLLPTPGGPVQGLPTARS